MITTSLIILIFFQASMCDVPLVNFDLKERNLHKFPWMVAITSELSLVEYGSLIHRKAVLTLAVIKSEELKRIKVYANCIFDELDSYEDNYRCREFRYVVEYNIIERNNENYQNNLAVLILDNPFQLSDKVNVIKLRKAENETGEYGCGVLSLKSIKNFNSTPRLARSFSMNIVIMNNRTWIEPPFPLYNSQEKESYEVNANKSLIINFVGSPLVCPSLTEPNKYVQIGVVNIVLKDYGRIRMFLGDVMRIDGEDRGVQKIIREIFKSAYIFHKQKHN